MLAGLALALSATNAIALLYLAWTIDRLIREVKRNRLFSDGTILEVMQSMNNRLER